MSTLTPSLEDIALQPLFLDLEVAKNQVSESHRALTGDLQSRVEAAVRCIADPSVRESTDSIVQQLLRLLDWLKLIDSNLHKLDTLRESLSLLELVHIEARSLIEFIQVKSVEMEGHNAALREVLDGIAYSLTHDLKRVFEGELMGPIAEQTTPVVYGKIVHSHGLLSNCLQQSTITLVQLFDQALDGARLFNDHEERLEQSLLLCGDLLTLLRVVRRAQSKPTNESLNALVKQIETFRDGSMQYLMYRDWKGYEKLAHEIIMSLEHDGDYLTLLNQFHCYLETLFGHVRMRAVLTNVAVQNGPDLPADGSPEDSAATV
jgi:hypothetical protein